MSFAMFYGNSWFLPPILIMIIIVDNRQDGAKRTVKNHSITRAQAHTAYSDKKIRGETATETIGGARILKA